MANWVWCSKHNIISLNVALPLRADGSAGLSAENIMAEIESLLLKKLEDGVSPDQRKETE
jgi:hypothetical protein